MSASSPHNGAAATATSTGLDHEALSAAVSARLEQMITDIQRLITTETPSEDTEAVARGAADIQLLLRERLNVEAEVIVIEDVTHLRLRFGSQTPKVVLLNHQDTVWPMGTLDRKPFSRHDGVLRGPGVFDMLTGVVMSIHAAAALHELGHSLEGLSILITGDEELGSYTSRDLVTEESAAAQAVFVLESSAGGALKLARKGTSNYRVAVHGKAAHAGLEPENGINAGLGLGAVLPLISALGDQQQGTTVTPTTLSGGRTSNTVPDYAVVDVDARATTVAEQQRVDAQIHQLHCPVEGARIEVTGGIRRPPMEGSASAELFASAQEVAAELGLPELAGVEVGGASDGNFSAAAGAPTLDGMGAVGDGANAEHEHTLVEFIAPRTALLAGLIHRYLNA